MIYKIAVFLHCLFNIKPNWLSNYVYKWKIVRPKRFNCHVKFKTWALGRTMRISWHCGHRGARNSMGGLG